MLAAERILINKFPSACCLKVPPHNRSTFIFSTRINTLPSIPKQITQPSDTGQTGTGTHRRGDDGPRTRAHRASNGTGVRGHTHHSPLRLPTLTQRLNRPLTGPPSPAGAAREGKEILSRKGAPPPLMHAQAPAHHPPPHASNASLVTAPPAGGAVQSVSRKLPHPRHKDTYSGYSTAPQASDRRNVRCAAARRTSAASVRPPHRRHTPYHRAHLAR